MKTILLKILQTVVIYSSGVTNIPEAVYGIPPQVYSNSSSVTSTAYNDDTESKPNFSRVYGTLIVMVEKSIDNALRVAITPIE